MTTYNYLGWGVTDSNGVAHLDHDAQGQEIEHSYTGTGAGEVDVIASTDNPISSGSIVSEPYNVWDYLIYDGGVTGDKSDNWTFDKNGLDNAKVETDETGTTFSATGAGRIPKYINNTLLTGDFEITFQARQENGIRWGFTTDKTTVSNVVMLNSSNNWLYYKTTRINGVFTIKVSSDGINWSITSNFADSNDDYYFGFFIQLVSQSTRLVTYKNLKIVRI